MRRMMVVVLASLLAVSGFAAPSNAASTKPVPFPAKAKGLTSPVTLPSELDPTPRYVPQIACQPGTPAGVVKLRALVLKTYGVGGAGNTSRGCNEGTSEHSDGRAWDWMVNVKSTKERAAAGDFLAWLTANHGENAKRLGIMYVIHNKKIWAVYREKDGWRPSYGHTDHIHVSFSWNGARGTTSFWTGSVERVDYGPCRIFKGQPGVVRYPRRTSPCPPAASLVKTHRYSIAMYGKRHWSVATAQGYLKIARTGSFDSPTRSAVLAYQRKHDLPITGALDVPTWSSLVRVRVTGDVSKGYTSRTAAQYGLKYYAGKSLTTQSAGKVVSLLQRSLRMGAADRNGYFGPVTKAAVKAFQRSAKLPETGIVRQAEWKALATR